jgi:hypothetical protein
VNGLNQCIFQGYIKNPSVRQVGQYNSSLYKARLAIPVAPPDTGYQYIKLSSFNCADALAEVPEGSFVRIEAHFEETNFMGSCHHCGGRTKIYWSEFVVDNFKVLE